MNPSTGSLFTDQNLSRRTVLKRLAVLGAASAVPDLAFCLAKDNASMKRKNILFIQTDSHDGRLLGCLGNPAMRRATPNIDALAKRGFLFRNAYTNNPICCPSRSSMWSGQYTHRCEAWNNYKGLAKGTRTFQTDLEEAGYQFQIFGKVDITSGKHTVRARVSPWTRSARIMLPNFNEAAPQVLPEDRERVFEGDWNQVDATLNWLRTERKSNAPFCVYLGLEQPHPGFRTVQRYLDRIEATEITVPATDGDKHPALEYQRISKNWEHGFSEEMVRKVRHVYYAMIAEVDAMVGRTLDGLREMGLEDDTIVIFTSDHGELAMEHQQFYKMSFYEASARIPMIIAGPGIPKGCTSDSLVSLIDIYPTLMDLAGVPQPAGLDGHSFLPEVRGEKNSRPDWVMGEYHDCTSCTGQFMLRQGDWKYICWVGYDPQLFNVAADPGEMTNLAKSRPDIVREMDAKLRGIVDYEAVDAKVKAYDRASFRAWRDERKRLGDYERLMGKTFSGWDSVNDDQITPWTPEREQLITDWLDAPQKIAVPPYFPAATAS